jgi:hypothetical protein
VADCDELGPEHCTFRVWFIWMRNYWVAGGPLAIMIVAAGGLILHPDFFDIPIYSTQRFKP